MFLELWVANLLFAYGWKWLKGSILVALVTASAVVLIGLAVSHHGLDAGSSLASLPVGVARVMFSFFAGVLLARIHRSRPGPRIPSWLIVVAFTGPLLFLPASLPSLPLELGLVILLFPTLVYLGAGATELHPWVGKHLGNASYAAYAIHIPLLAGATWLLARTHHSPGAATSTLFISGVVAAALMLDEYYDKQARRWLTKRFLRRVTEGRGSGSSAGAG